MPTAADRRHALRRRHRDRGGIRSRRCGAPERGPRALAFAAAFARLIRLAPRPAEVSTLDPAPSWAAWNHGRDGLWPCPEEDPDVNLNEVAGPEWIDHAGRCARDRLRAGESDAVIGHCDWLAGNLRWSSDALLVVFLVAYCQARGREFSVDELQRSWAAGVWTRAYDAKYQHAVGRPITSLSEDEARERLRRTGTGSQRRSTR